MSRPMVYKVRPGTNDLGRKYEYKMAALFALKFALKDGEMWMASNAPNVGAFDDIVVHHAGFTHLLQLKHKENSKDILEQELLSPKGDLALPKYFKDIAKLKQDLNTVGSRSEFQNYLGTFSAIHFVIFTNRSINESTYKCQFLEKSANAEVNLLNCKHDGKVHRINANELPPSISMADPKDYGRVFLISNQVDAKRLDYVILQETKKAVRYYKLIEDDTEIIAERFTNFIQYWAEGYAGGRHYHCLTKADVLQKLSEIMLSKYVVNFTNAPFLPYVSANEQIWNSILESKKVTVTKYSEAVFEFLLQYISYEVKKYCASGDASSWYSDLPEQLKNLFYQNHASLKTQMIRITKHLDAIKPLDIYKCLWTAAKIPVLLEVATIRHFNDVQRILKFSSNFHKVLILNKCEETFKYDDEKQKGDSFFSLNDVSETDRNSILRINVCLQGRGPIGLGFLITEQMFHHVTCENIVNILSGRFNIGNTPARLTDYFIERKVSKIFIKSQALDDVKRDKFIIGEHWEEYLNLAFTQESGFFKRRSFDASPVQNPNTIGFGMNSIRKRPDNRVSHSIHYLDYYNDQFFEWKSSIGSVSSIKRFVVDLEDVTESDIVSKLSSKITLLSGAPGMGKSVLLDYLTHKVPATRWVIKVDLNAHTDYFKELKEQSSMDQTEDHLKYFYNFYTSPGNKNLSEVVFDKLRSSKDVVVMMDGFDEISLQYKEEVVDIAKSLCNEGCRVCITTRHHVQEYLEETLETFSITLKSFSEDDQKNFLRKYFSGGNDLNSESQKCISQFVEDLLQATKNNLVDLDAEFTGIPLQTKLLAEAFEGDCRRALSHKHLNGFSRTFDLIYLFRSFINKKMEILASKKGYSIEKAYLLFQKPQAVLALKLIFPSHCDIIEYVEKQPGYGLLNDSAVLQEGGIVTIDQHSNITFIHRTFGEYLAAKWLSENFNNQDEKIKEIARALIKERFTQDHKFLFILFDRILAKECPLLLDIINKKIRKVIYTINTDVATMLATDKCGRSFLHILGLYSTPYPPLYKDFVQTSEAKEFLDSHTFETENTLDILADTIGPINNIVAPSLDQLGYSPLDYALANRSLGIAEQLCSFWKKLPIQVHVKMKVMTEYLAYCALEDFKTLFDLLSIYFLYRNVLLNNVNMEETVERFYKNTFSSYERGVYIYMYDSDVENRTIWQLLLEEGSQIIPALQNLDTDIHMATIFGHKEKATWLILRSNDINKGDNEYNNTVLHYSILHNKIGIFRKILEKGADVNRINIVKDTPLHLAARKTDKYQSAKTFLKKIKTFSKDETYPNHKKIVKMLLSKGAQINVQNKDGDTPLYLALENRNQQMAKLFILKGADLGITNKLGASCLHFAAFNGCDDVLRYLLSQKVDVNSQMNFKQTPLSLAVANNNLSSVKLLLSSGAKINTQDSNGKTCLHTAASNGANDVVEALTSSTDIDIDKEDALGYTPLKWAVSMDNNDTVKLLILRGARIDIPDKSNETCLHLAVIMGYNHIVHQLLPADTHLINLQDKYGSTALHYAAFNENLHVVSLLLAHSADVNIQNRNGESCLHTAVFSGSLRIVEEILTRRIVSSVILTNYSAQDTQGEISNKAAYNGAISTTHGNSDDSGSAFTEKASFVYINALDNKGKTALAYAVEEDLLDMAQLLMT